MHQNPTPAPKKGKAFPPPVPLLDKHNHGKDAYSAKKECF